MLTEASQAYLDRTSILIPIPPSVYKSLPRWVKQFVLLDLPMFQFDEHTDGKQALEEEQKKHQQSA